jgi:DEAD/DEAH box helicase domain-containing protein
MRKVVFDIETTNRFLDVGSADPAKLDLAIVCIWDSETNEYSSYLMEELPKLWPIIEQTDMLIGYNSDHFDVPLLNKYYPGDLTKIKSLDLLKEIRSSLGRRLKMDSIAEATLGAGKTADGLQSIQWWKEGKVDLVRKYCISDVKITKELYEYALQNNKLFYKDLGNKREIPLNTSKWEEAGENSMTFTLPF